MSHNAFLQKFFSPMTDDTAKTVWFADEFGLALPIAAGLSALVYWQKGVREFGRGKT